MGTHYAPHCLCCTRLCIMEGDSNSQKWTLNEFCPIPTGVGLTAPYNLCCAILESCGDCPPDSKSLVLRSAKKGRLREGGLRHTFRRPGVLNCRIFEDFFKATRGLPISLKGSSLPLRYSTIKLARCTTGDKIEVISAANIWFPRLTPPEDVKSYVILCIASSTSLYKIDP